MVDAVHVLSRSVMSDSFVTPWIAAHQAPLSLGFLRQGHWSALPVPSSGDLPNAGIEPKFSCITGGFFTAEPSGKSRQCTQCTQKVWGRKKKKTFQNSIFRSLCPLIQEGHQDRSLTVPFYQPKKLETPPAAAQASQEELQRTWRAEHPQETWALTALKQRPQGKSPTPLN